MLYPFVYYYYFGDLSIKNPLLRFGCSYFAQPAHPNNHYLSRIIRIGRLGGVDASLVKLHLWASA